ncbi:ribonucleotide-diphosphate reductase subunit beta [Salibacterium salarium]|uniref:Ribonucleoside-diphosphate reductase subunit beta n=1 Tax=Salibacterium salarium TaxID=284579 RepID=A0A3R9P334_9BACI|nr:ribonucleotide-diphosphate reductase subunit beta [Salibacterium salarium]RSL29138.1 ribonucleotide-diphosphate reductase subunit beta [Salibacterium salarium]
MDGRGDQPLATLERVKILEPENPNRSTALFGGKASGILNWNDIPYPHFYDIRKEMRALFWIADEVDMSSDKKQFPTLPQKERTAFLKINGLLAEIDGPQTDLAARISNFSTDPSVKATFATEADQESEHNQSYAYVLSSVATSDQQIASFEEGRTDPVLLRRNQRMIDIYNEFAVNPTIETVLRALLYTVIAEGLFFYSGFAFFYNLARNQKMLGTAKMISFINRDELQHSKFAGELFRATLAENPEYNTKEFTEWIYEEFENAVEQEIEWSRYVLDGIDGIDLVEMAGYVKYRANKMLRMVGLSDIYEGYTENPMKWIRAYSDNFDDTKGDFFETDIDTYAKITELNGFDKL